MSTFLFIVSLFYSRYSAHQQNERTEATTTFKRAFALFGYSSRHNSSGIIELGIVILCRIRPKKKLKGRKIYYDLVI